MNHPTYRRENTDLSQGKQWKGGEEEGYVLSWPLLGRRTEDDRRVVVPRLAGIPVTASVCPRQAVQGCVGVLCSCFSWKFHIC